MHGSTPQNTIQFIAGIVDSLPIWFWITLAVMCLAGAIVAFIKGITKVAIILLILLILNFIVGGKSAVILKYASTAGSQASNTITEKLQK